MSAMIKITEYEHPECEVAQLEEQTVVCVSGGASSEDFTPLSGFDWN